MKFSQVQGRWIRRLSSKKFQDRIRREDPSMLENIEKFFLPINQLGFLTFDSQDGKQERGTSVLNGKPYLLTQRAYMMGFLKRSQAITFIKNMAIFTDKNAIVIPHGRFLKKDKQLDPALDLPLTITRIDGETRIDTHMSSAFSEEMFLQQLRELGLEEEEDIVIVFCWDSQWNRKEKLFQDILRVLQA